jgi:hypothetical protein
MSVMAMLQQLRQEALSVRCCWGPFSKQNALYLVAVESLCIPSNAYFHLHSNPPLFDAAKSMASVSVSRYVPPSSVRGGGA